MMGNDCTVPHAYIESPEGDRDATVASDSFEAASGVPLLVFCFISPRQAQTFRNRSPECIHRSLRQNLRDTESLSHKRLHEIRLARITSISG